MNKLSKLYQMLENSKELGIPLTDEQVSQINALEEDFIKKEILPIVQNSIEPALEPVRRSITLVVEYSPGKPLQLRLSRKANSIDYKEAKIIEPDPQVAHDLFGPYKPRKVKNPRQNLRLTLPSGQVIEHSTAARTLVDFIRLAGPMQVRALGLITNKVQLVSNTRDEKYGRSQYPIGDGWYVMTLSSTATKKKQIETIANALGITVKVDLI